ncbi:MAG: NUDIX domain-containing protein [Candidatus Moranbacteria bacterium]|nr:NUDIX domain-containing protein [Candidatus Moranbacteria bacterium]
MAHVHTAPGQIDYAVDVFVVYENKVLLRFHDKHDLWLAPGGHIELDELPEEAAVREVLEEVGLDVELVFEDSVPEEEAKDDDRQRELHLPSFTNVHYINESHRHLSFVYIARATTDKIIEPEGEEKSGGCIWLTKEELLAHPEVRPNIKRYALRALEVLAS